MGVPIKKLNQLAKRAGCVFKIDTNNIIYQWELAVPDPDPLKPHKINVIRGDGFNHNFQNDDVPVILETLNNRISLQDELGYFVIQMLFDYFDLKKGSWYIMTYDEMIVLDDSNDVCPVCKVMYKTVGRIKVKSQFKVQTILR